MLLSNQVNFLWSIFTEEQITAKDIEIVLNMKEYQYVVFVKEENTKEKYNLILD